MASFKDFFSEQSADYARFRPRYPRALFMHISSACSAHGLAWDCGTGNGQAALALSSFFQRVIGTDASENQLKQAEGHPKVSYRLAKAEQSGLDSHSADLITVAQAFHWFDAELFFSEVKRVAKPGGVLALWCYELCTISPKVDSVIFELYKEILGPFWDEARRLVEDGYRNISVPFDEIPAPKASMGLSWSFADLVGYLGTWSALQKARAQTGEDPRLLIIPKLQAAWGDLGSEKLVTWPIAVRMFRIG